MGTLPARRLGNPIVVGALFKRVSRAHGGAGYTFGALVILVHTCSKSGGAPMYMLSSLYIDLQGHQPAAAPTGSKAGPAARTCRRRPRATA